jgi:hypothetical protein
LLLLLCVRYNAELRLNTLRWAVLELLKKPPPGLEDVVTHHFRYGAYGVSLARTAPQTITQYVLHIHLADT